MLHGCLTLLALFLGSAVQSSGDRALRVETVGRGCCSSDVPPTLDVVQATEPDHAYAQRPVVELTGSGAPRTGAGWLLVSGQPSVSLDLGNGGFLFVEPNRLLCVHPFAVDELGAWRVPCTLPSAVLCTDLSLVVQAMFPDPGMSIRFALSDAIQVSVH